MNSEQNNIKALKLFLELVLTSNISIDNPIADTDSSSKICSFDVMYYEYRCDNCLSIGNCIENSSKCESNWDSKCYSESTRECDSCDSCDSCDLCDSESSKCCQSKRFVRCVPVRIMSSKKEHSNNTCIKCGSVSDLQSTSSDREMICVNDYYKDERDALYDLMCVLWLKDKETYETIIQKLVNMLSLVKKLTKLLSSIIQTHKPINFEKINVFKNKELLTDIAFMIASQFTEFMTYFDSENIRNYYKNAGSCVPFNWLLYIMYTLFQNAFSDAITDNSGKITMESIVHIENTIVKTNQILSRSIEGIVKAVKFRK